MMETRSAATPFWESPEQVARFGSRAPDHRLVDLLSTYPAPGTTRVLDLGCAAGRNAVLLAERGFDLTAIDSSLAMVGESRRRVARVLGTEEAEARVSTGRMDDLGRWPDGWFDLVVALGVYHQARSQAEWDRAVAETHRVLRSQGQVLVSVFSPASVPGSGRLTPLAGQPHVFSGFASGALYLLDATALDRSMMAHGFDAVLSPETVTVTSERSGEMRVTVNALYRKQTEQR